MSRISFATILATSVACFLLTFVGCDLDTRESANLAKSTFEGTVKGDVSIAKNIDWQTFRFQGEDYGPSYLTLATDYQRTQFKSAIIMKMSAIFNAKNWTAVNVRNWKVGAKGVESAIVSAEVQGGGGKITMYIQKVSLEKKIHRIEYQ